MIYYLCARPPSYTLGQYFHAWAPELAARFTVVTYDALEKANPPKAGVYVFADLDQLAPRGMELALRFRRSLEPLRDQVRVLNEPTRVLRRYDLLRALHERGINSFDAYRLGEGRHPRSWPVLLRREHEHLGAIGDLVRTTEELRAAVARMIAAGQSTKGLIAVEFRDTADDRGVYRKYGAFLIGERLIPRHLLVSRHWCVKDPDLLEPDYIEEELRFVETFPRADEVRSIFEIAGIDYGRIDYSFYGDRLHVWEINTNPVLAYVKSAEPGAPRREVNERFARLARDAFLALDAPFSA